MLLTCLLIVSLLAVLAFALSKDTGKNTKYARKGATFVSQTPKPRSIQTDTSSVAEIN
ncbi:MAG: hypothetical protein ACI965_000487 [Paraglaciecola sp.]|jgi:hypothetical protein